MNRDHEQIERWKPSEASSSKSPLEPLPPCYSVEELQRQRMLKNEKHLHYWRPIRFRNQEFMCFEVLNPRREWWVLVEKKAMVQFLEAHGIRCGRSSNDTTFSYFMSGSKQLPWPLTEEVLESQMEFYQSTGNSWPRAVPFRHLLQIAKDSVGQNGLRVEDVVQDQYQAQHRRAVIGLEMFSEFSRPAMMEKLYYQQLPLIFRSRPVHRIEGPRVPAFRQRKNFDHLFAKWVDCKEKGSEHMAECRQACYPCLVAGRKCERRRRHKLFLQAYCCKACKRNGLTFRQCAVPEKKVKDESSGPVPDSWITWQHEMMLERSTMCLSCHICGNIGPCPRATECINCHIWVCGNETCRRLAKVQEQLPYWYCCHCLGLPLQCACDLGLKEAVTILLQTEVVLPPGFQTIFHQEIQGQPTSPAELRHFKQQSAPMTLKGGMERLEAETCWIDDAGILRQLTLLEFKFLKSSLKGLKNEIRKSPHYALTLGWYWLTKIQKLGTPDMVLNQLLHLHGLYEKNMIMHHDKKRVKFKPRIPTYLEALIAGWQLPANDDQYIAAETREFFEKQRQRGKKRREQRPVFWRELLRKMEKHQKKQRKKERKEKKEAEKAAKEAEEPAANSEPVEGEENEPVEGEENEPVEGEENEPVEGEENEPVEGEENEPVEEEENEPVEGEENGPVEGEENGPVEGEENGPVEGEENKEMGTKHKDKKEKKKRKKEKKEKKKERKRRKVDGGKGGKESKAAEAADDESESFGAQFDEPDAPPLPPLEGVIDPEAEAAFLVEIEDMTPEDKEKAIELRKKDQEEKAAEAERKRRRALPLHGSMVDMVAHPVLVGYLKAATKRCNRTSAEKWQEERLRHLKPIDPKLFAKKKPGGQKPGGKKASVEKPGDENIGEEQELKEVINDESEPKMRRTACEMANN